MSLDALAPDQRAVVQLVLQQERSYDELAGLLGISADAVRERAVRGLDRLAPDSAVDEEDRALIVDYLLGQQSVSRREATRSLLADDAAAAEWARTIAAELGGVARGSLPEIPATARTEREPFAADEDEDDDLTGPFIPDSAEEDEPAPAAQEEDRTTESPTVRARPRPRGATRTKEPAGAALGPDLGLGTRRAERDRGRSSKLGGALLIGGLAIVLVVLVVFLVNRGDDGDDGGTTASATPTATATATATPAFEEVGQIALSGTGDAKGQVRFFAASTGAIAFAIQATGVPQNTGADAYAVWLTGGDKPHWLGFAEAVGKNGKFATQGPQESDATKFPQWLAKAKQIVVTKETTAEPKQPGETILSGKVPSGQ